MTTYLVYAGVRRFARYANWVRRNLGDAFTVPANELMPIEVRVDPLTPAQRTFLDELLAMTGGLDERVVIATDDPGDATLTRDAAIASALQASRVDWQLGGTGRVEWALEYPRCWVVLVWFFPNMPPGLGYIVDKATRRAFVQRWIDVDALRSRPDRDGA